MGPTQLGCLWLPDDRRLSRSSGRTTLSVDRVGFSSRIFCIRLCKEIMKNPRFALGFALGVFASLMGIRLSVLLPTASGETVLVDRMGAVPVVSTSPLTVTNEINASGSGYILKLDGIDCVNCEVSNGAVVQYGGGPFKLEHFRHSGVVTFDLKGAALNTKILLSSFGFVGCPASAPKRRSTDPKTSALKTLSTNQKTFDLSSSPVGEK